MEDEDFGGGTVALPSPLTLVFVPPFHQISESVLQSVLKCLVDVINIETSTLASVAMQALGHIGICIPLPPLLIDSTGGEMTFVLVKYS